MIYNNCSGICYACRTNNNIFGAICGDILGSTFEFEKKKYNNISEIDLFRDGSHFTDDTVLTLAVADWLLHDLNDYEDDDYFKDKLVKRMVDYVCRKYKNQPLGYGFSFWQWCNKAYLIDEYEPYNSFGNGSAMRVSPVGWFFDTMEETMRFAKLSADITHNHPEGEKGAMCIAAAIFLARNGKSKDEIKEYIIREFGYSGLDFSVEVLREKSIYSVKMNYDNGIWSYDMNAKLDDSDKKKIVIKEVTVEAAPSASGSQRSLHSANKAAGALAIGVLGNDNALHAHLREAQGAGEREEVWAQYLGGKLKSDGMQLKHNGVELGYDAYVGNNWTFGVSGMQTRGNTQLDSGSGKAKTNVGTVYGAWHGGSSYLNLEAKAGRVSSESKTFGGTVLQKIAGEFSAPAYSVSAEYGSTHELPAAWYLEPAVRLSYVHMGAADYSVRTQETLARVANDSFDSFILRGGAKLGRRLGAKGSFYVKAAAVYDFGGDLATTVSADGRTEHYEDSLGGWGVEYGAGLEYKLGKAANISLDVERRSGGELKRDWGVNIGVNYSF